jgi:hypothetical protein
MCMCYWDFTTVMESAKLRNDRVTGKPVIRDVPQSNKDMITRAKELRKHVR